MNDLVKALRAGEQADMDGILVKVSRQACEEAADAIEALQARVAKKDAEIERLKLALGEILSYDRNFYDSGRPGYEAIARAALKESPDA